MKTENLDQFLCDIERLKRAEKILERIWTCLGPYNLTIDLKFDNYDLNSGERPLLQELTDYFDFNDNE